MARASAWPRSSVKVQRSFKSLRAHDVHQGIQAGEIDRNAGLVAEELEATQLVGMAAALATAIKGLDHIPDGSELKRVASQQYDVPPLAFPRIVRTLEEAEFVRNVKREGDRINSFYVNVPEDYDRTYAVLDQVYDLEKPSELDQSLLAVVDELSMGPQPVEELDVDPDLLEDLIQVGGAAEAIKVVELADLRAAYSPFFAYENPKKMDSLLREVDVERVRDSFARVRKYQGMPVLEDDNGTALSGLIGAGLMAGPHLQDPKGQLKMFAMAPYGLPHHLLTVEKPVLDKAMAIVAAIRMGQNWGGATPIRFPVTILRRVLDGNWMARHSSTARQYSVLYELGIVEFDKATARKAIRLIDTPDNRRAVGIAIDLLSKGEAIQAKEIEVGHLALPDPAGNYRGPLHSIRPARRRTPAPRKVIADVIAIAGGWKPSV